MLEKKDRLSYDIKLLLAMKLDCPDTFNDHFKLDKYHIERFTLLFPPHIKTMECRSELRKI